MAVAVAPPTNAIKVSLNGSLTCLGWLQQLGCRSGLQQPLATPNVPSISVARPPPQLQPKKKSKVKRDAAAAAGSSMLDPLISNWDTSSTEKPPHCYATLIYMSMRGKSKVTLGEIYSYVKSTFKYYKANDNGWKNSIRHNLTQHKCFVKVQRTDDHPGKGGFWTLSAGHEVMFKNGIFKRKRRKMTASVLPGKHDSRHLVNGKSAGKAGPAATSPKGRRKFKNGLHELSKQQGSDSQKPLHGNRPVFFCSEKRRVSSASSAMTGFLDVLPEADGEVLDGIDWDAMVPDFPDGELSAGEDRPDQSGSGNVSLDANSSMIGALSLMETNTGSPISILPDINQNDGSSTPAVEFSLNELHSELHSELEMGSKMLTVSQQLRAVESKLDLDSDSTDAEDCMWSGEELTVVGTGLTLAESIVPIMDDGRDCNHVVLTDLDDSTMPADWMIQDKYIKI